MVLSREGATRKTLGGPTKFFGGAILSYWVFPGRIGKYWGYTLKNIGGARAPPAPPVAPSLVSNDFLLNLSQKSKFWKWLILPFFAFLSPSVEKLGIFFHFSALYRSIIWCWHLLPDTIPLRCLSAHVQQFEAYSIYYNWSKKKYH